MPSPLQKQIYASFGPICLYFSNGYLVGLVSVILPDLRNSSIKLTTEQESWLPSLMTLMLFPSQFICGLMTHQVGRKYIFIASLVPSIFTYSLFYIAQDYVTFLLAFMLGGLTGGGSAIGPMLIAEVCSPKYRGVLSNVKTAAVIIGIAIGHLLCNFFEWRSIVLYGIVVNVCGLITSSTTPESPSWFASKGRFEECKEAFYWFRGSEDTEELNELIEFQERDYEIEKMAKRKSRKLVQRLNTMLDRSFLIAVSINISISIILESLGGPLFFTYIFHVIESIMGSTNNIFSIIVAIDILSVTAQILSCVAVRKHKRRYLLFGLGFPCVFLLLAISMMTYLRDILPVSFSWINLFSLGLFNFLSQIGITPTLFTIMGEIYPLSFRGIGISVSSFVFVFLMFIVTKITPSLLRDLGIHGIFLLNSCFLGLSLVHLFYFLPETDKRTLQNIENELKKQNKDDIQTEVNKQMLRNDANSNCKV